MTDTAKQSPLKVHDSTVGPYMRLPLSQVEAVGRILDRHGIKYWVEDIVISMNHGPEIAWLFTKGNPDIALIQSLLDAEE
jgi:hypothetical protein